MADDKTFDSGLRQIGAGTADSVHGTYGSVTPESVDAALLKVGGAARDALNGVENVTVDVTTAVSGGAAGGSWSGSAPDGLRLKLTIPRGPAGPGADEAVAVATSQQAGTAARAEQAKGIGGVVWIGDSKSAGTGLMNYTDRAMNRVLAMLRSYWTTPGGDTGRGIIPANLSDPYNQMSGRPVMSSGALAADNVGLGYNTAHLPPGATVTWPSLSWPAAGSFTVGSHTNGLGAGGTLEVLVDGAVVGTINCAGTGEGTPIRTDFPIASGTHTIVVRGKAGGEPARVMYVEHRTAASGWRLYDASRPGLEARQVARGAPGNANSPSSFRESVWQLPSVALIVVALGANDMANYSPNTFAADIRTTVTTMKTIKPRAGALVVLPAALRNAPDNPPQEPGRVDDVAAYHSAVRNALVGVSDLTVISEAALVDARGGSADAWFVDGVHPAVFGHQVIAEAAMRALGGRA